MGANGLLIGAVITNRGNGYYKLGQLLKIRADLLQLGTIIKNQCRTNRF